MQKIALITDSGSDLSLEELREYNVNLLPLRISYSTGEYQDKIDIKASDVYENLDKEVPKTSLPSPETTEKILTKLEEEGYTHVKAICISGGLSGTANSLRLSLEDHPNLTSYVYDTKILAYPEGEIVIEVSKLIKSGKTFEEIIEALPKIREKITGYFTIDTLEYLKKGGRIGRVAGTLGEMLNLKPIITTDENGVYYNIVKARGRKQALSKLTDILKTHLAKNKCDVTVLQGGCEAEAIKYMESLKGLDNINSLKLSEISPALGVHGGPGLMGFCVKVVD